MCSKLVQRNYLTTLLLIAFLSAAPYLLAATRGIQVIPRKGQPMYLYKDYHALVVGVSDYEYWPDLPGAVRDAREVASSLKEIGFKVKLLLNSTSSQLRKAFNDLTYKVGREPDRAILFYFAGHGQTETLANQMKLGYIVPKDCPLLISNPAGFVDKAISMKVIEAYALRINSKHVLMAFDSCFSGSVFASVRSAPADISEKSAKPVRQFITAGNENEQVPDQSVFKLCFLDGIAGEADLNNDGYVTGSELGMYIDTKVVNYSNGSQHPQYGKIRDPRLDKGDFIFALKGDDDWLNEQQAMEARLKQLKGQTQEAEKRVSELEAKKKTAKLREEILEEQRRKDEAEKKARDLERQQKLAYIPKKSIKPKVALRSKPQFPSTSAVKNMCIKYNFFCDIMNEKRSFTNDFQDNKDGTVIDYATGLMWQQQIDRRYLNLKEATEYVKALNKEHFAGYSDWRLPTIEELVSLIQSKRDKTSGLLIDPVFSGDEGYCWTADRNRRMVWYVAFKSGTPMPQPIHNCRLQVISVRSIE